MFANALALSNTNTSANAISVIKEVGASADLGIDTITHWKNGTGNATSNIFLGKASVDEQLEEWQEFTNFAGLLHSFDNGAWVDSIPSVNASENAISQYLAYALPIAELLNDDVRPTRVYVYLLLSFGCIDTPVH